MVRLLGKAGAGPTLDSPCGNRGLTPLHTASEYPDTVQVLLGLGADPDRCSEDSRTPVGTIHLEQEVLRSRAPYSLPIPLGQLLCRCLGTSQASNSNVRRLLMLYDTIK